MLSQRKYRETFVEEIVDWQMPNIPARTMICRYGVVLDEGLEKRINKELKA